MTPISGKAKRMIRGVVLVGLVAVLSLTVGAAAATPPPATPTPGGEATVVAPLNSDYGGVVAEGKVEPGSYVDLSFKVSGEVEEIVVDEGGQVKAGEVIVRLKGDQSLQAKLTLAEQGLVNAQQALDDLGKNEGVEQAQVQAAIAQYSDQLRKAKQASYNYTAPSRVAIYGMFEAADKMNEKLKKAREEYEPYKELADNGNSSASPALFCMPQWLCRGGAVQSRDDPARVYNKKVTDAEGDFSIALTQIRNAANSESAQALLDKAQRDYEKVKGGVNTDKLAVAEKGLEAAQYNLEAAQRAIADLELRAPIDGTVANLKVKVGEHVTAGKTIVQVGDLSRWVVKSDNLTEIQVVKVTEGQTASVAADALPGVELKGEVESISNYYQKKDNDIIYTVKVALTKPDPRLRWGMTVVATFPSQ